MNVFSQKPLRLGGSLHWQPSIPTDEHQLPAYTVNPAGLFILLRMQNITRSEARHQSIMAQSRPAEKGLTNDYLCSPSKFLLSHGAARSATRICLPIPTSVPFWYDCQQILSGKRLFITTPPLQNTSFTSAGAGPSNKL
jgi:hypothetical protein